jgi:putative PIG3 family NAD(P)H quinone oxidoreductase
VARRDLAFAARNFRFQSCDAVFQLMRGKRGNIFPQMKIWRLFARIFNIHDRRYPWRPLGLKNIAQTKEFVMRAIAIENPGRSYRLVLQEMETPRPGGGEVLIQVAASGLNRADLLQAQGHYPPPPGASEILGMEISGTLAALGDGVTGWAVGDKVCALIPGGGYAQYAVAAASCLLAVPSSLPLDDAASFPEALFTVWTNLFDTARLQPGESVMVHGGSSGIGVTAIQLLCARGHTVFTTAGNEQKCRACETLGAKRAINYRSEDFAEVILAETGGTGVDVILDMVGGDYIQRNMAAAAMGGRIVNIAYQKGAKAEVNFMPLMLKRLALLGTTLRSRSLGQKAAIRDAVAHEAWPLVAAGRIRPVVEQKLPLAEAQKAHEIMENSGHIGKILLLAP